MFESVDYMIPFDQVEYIEREVRRVIVHLPHDTIVLEEGDHPTEFLDAYRSFMRSTSKVYAVKNE